MGSKLIQYNEDYWNGLPEERKQHCTEVWTKEALADESCDFLVLKLVPDPIFPSGENEYPYVHWQVDLRAMREGPKLFEAFAHVRVVLAVPLDVPTRSAVERELLKYPNGTRYTVVDNVDPEIAKILLTGKVNK